MIKDVMRRAIRSAVEKANGKIVIGQATPVQMGFVVGILGSLFLCVWWAATINGKLDVLVDKLGIVESGERANREDVNNLKLWKAEIERNGPRALDEFRKEFEQFRLEFRVHSAKPPVP